MGLCEKPMASNAKEAEAMLAAANAGNSLLVEAFHYRFHPVATRMKEIVESGRLGAIKDISTGFQIPSFFVPHSDIRYDVGGTIRQLAGGSLMDAGCYAMNCLRLLAGAEPSSVINASVVEAFPGVDESAEASLLFSNGITGSIVSSFVSWTPSVFAEVRGSEGSMSVTNFILPFVYHRIDLMDSNGVVVGSEKLYGDGESTYEHQLRAFVGAVRGDEEKAALIKFAGSAEGAVKNMAAIDAVYVKAGLQPRQGVGI